MRRLTVRAGRGSYPVVIGNGALREFRRSLGGRDRTSSVHLVTDTRVARMHGETIAAVLAATGLPVSRSVLPEGEGSKSFRQLERILRAAVRAGCDRRTCLVAFGGGVVGDVAGYAAASLFRGVDFVQVPTSLLAMVDASVGGKTGINLPEGKNLAGAFHPPRAVIMDLALLETLAPRHVRAGWAEIIKTAAIADARFLRRIEREREALLGAEEKALSRAIARCVEIKASVVEEDERERGLRMVLNFGHTLAHGIEAAQGFGGLLHGEAVAVGMVFAARLGERLGRTAAGTAERLERLLAAYGLPTRASGLEVSRVLAAVGRDKKRGPAGLRWVLLKEPGEAMIAGDVPPETSTRELRQFLARRSKSQDHARRQKSGS